MVSVPAAAPAAVLVVELMLGPPSLLSIQDLRVFQPFRPLLSRRRSPRPARAFRLLNPRHFRPSRLFLLFSRSALRVWRSSLLLVFRRSFSSIARGARDATAPLAPRTPRTSNAASATAPQRPSDVLLLQRKARSSASFPLVLVFSCSSCFCCSCFLLVFVFVPAAQADESDAPLEAPPPRRARKGRISNPPQSAPGAKPSVPRAFPFTAPKTILDRAGDDNLSKGLIDPFGWAFRYLSPATANPSPSLRDRKKNTVFRLFRPCPRTPRASPAAQPPKHQTQPQRLRQSLLRRTKS